MPSRLRRALALLPLALLGATPAVAAPELEPVASFSQPTYVTSPPDDPRLFVTERAGVVRIVGKDGALKPAPFLDISSHTTTVGERGLLSMAFPPDYAASGLAYVFVTGVDGSLQIRELSRSSSDPNRAEPGVGRLVLRQPHPQFENHNGGQLQFDSGGLLYAGFGDGGGSDDPGHNGQNLGTLLGKLIRIDPRTSAGGAAYTIPQSNPFAGSTPGRDEIWAYGLRNPWRFSFDRQTGELWIGDVGEGAREEVDLAAAGVGGQNFGWRCYEGTIPTPTVEPPCAPPGHVPPLFDLEHEMDEVCSITGGYVVRDPGLPSLAGRYLYGDLCRPEIQASANGEPGTATGMAVNSVVSFGQDACGRLYTVSFDGPVSRIRDGATTVCDLPEPTAPPADPLPPTPPSSPAGGSPPAVVDRIAPRLSVRRRGSQRVRSGRAVKLTVTASEPATVRATLRVPRVGSLRSASRTLPAGIAGTFRVSLKSPRGKRVRAAAARRSRRATLTVSARDAAGNVSRTVRRVRLR